MAAIALRLWPFLAAATAALLLVGECASGGGMGAPYRTCRCGGYEWEVYDRRPADGPRLTICLGIMKSSTCYRFESGPEVECEAPRSGQSGERAPAALGAR